MPTRGLLVSIAVLLILSESLLMPLSLLNFRVLADPGTVRVPMDFPTIQSAIDHADPGDTILVYDGIYNETIQVDKTLAIAGQDSGATVIDGLGLGTVVNVTSSGVSIWNFTIRNGGSDQTRGGISLYVVSNCSIFSNNIVGNSVGILLNNASDNDVYHNNFVNNLVQVTVQTLGFSNSWDNGYPSGGNYWDSFSASDAKKGPDQNLPGSDGIIDSSYVIDTDNVDRYPFTSYWRPRTVKNLKTGLSYNSLQEAIDAPETAGGQIILVGKGIFYENVVVDKALQLQGESVFETIVDGGGVGSAINVTSDHVSITGLTLRHSGASGSDSAVFINNASNADINKNVIIDDLNGIYLYNANTCTIQSNNISSSRDGISLFYSNGNTVQANNLSEITDYGISLQSCNNNVVGKNHVQDAREGIRLESSSNNKIDQNDLDNWYDVHVVSSSNNKLSGNVASGVFVGFSFEQSAGNMVAGNNITGHLNVGLSLLGSSNNTIYYNNFIDNTYQTYVAQGDVNNWNMSYPIGGNYWSTYTGVDVKSGPTQNQTGSDGIGDTPFSVNSENTDNYPQIRKLDLTSAVDIHDVAVENVSVPETRIYETKSLNVTVQVANVGNYTESFSVTAYCSAGIIGTVQVSNFRPRAELPLKFTWSTKGLTPNVTYTIGANVTIVPGEINVGNNNLANVSVTVTFYRDVAVVNVTTSSIIIYQGGIASITVPVSNLGNVSETPTVRVFCRENLTETLIATQRVALLDAHTNVSLIFVWNTSAVTPYHNYTILAKIDPVPDEAILENNNFTGGQVRIRIPGDINGDKTVNILDIASIAAAFYSKIGNPKYSPILDLNNDGVINIMDIARAAMNFGRTSP